MHDVCIICFAEFTHIPNDESTPLTLEQYQIHFDMNVL